MNMTAANKIRQLFKDAGNTYYVYVAHPQWENPIRITNVKRQGLLVRVRTINGEWKTVTAEHKIYAQ